MSRVRFFSTFSIPNLSYQGELNVRLGKSLRWDTDQSRWSLLAFERWDKGKGKRKKEYCKLDLNLCHPHKHYGSMC